ncbi:MAG: iron-sulfur cluster assembly protein [Granulosicoccaceae bacterium]|jgi:metal-sulfur cluster biosynthetic enzyme
MITQNQIMEALSQVVDPELGVNIVDLGLVYGVEVQDGEVRVAMTLTTPGCPLMGPLLNMAEAAIRQAVPAVTSVKIEVVWDPPWDPSRMSEAAKRQLGLIK